MAQGVGVADPGHQMPATKGLPAKAEKDSMVDGGAEIGAESPIDCGSIHRSNNLYVKYFSARRDDESLADIFRECGTVVSSKVLRFHDGRSKQVGFVQLSTREEALKACKLNNKELGGAKHLHVVLAMSKEERQQEVKAWREARRSGDLSSPKLPPLKVPQSPFSSVPALPYSPPDSPRAMAPMAGYYPGPHHVKYPMMHGSVPAGYYPSSPAGPQAYYSDMTYSMPPTSQYILCDAQGVAYQYQPASPYSSVGQPASPYGSLVQSASSYGSVVQPASPYGSVTQWVASPVYANNYQMNPFMGGSPPSPGAYYPVYYPPAPPSPPRHASFPGPNVPATPHAPQTPLLQRPPAGKAAYRPRPAASTPQEIPRFESTSSGSTDSCSTPVHLPASP